MSNDTRFYKAKNLSEVLYHIKNVSNLKIYGGGTIIHNNDNPTLLNLGEDVLFVSNCDEFKSIEKHERYIDFGSAVTLTQILDLGRTNIPEFLYDAIKTVANPLIRNTATLTGNICAQDYYYTLYSPLLAVDAKLEIHNDDETTIVPISKFEGIKKGEFISKIRIPVIDWDLANFTRLGPKNEITDISNSFTFLSKSQKDTLIDVRIAFCGKIKIRSNELENNIIGSHLPLSERNITNELELASRIYDEQVINFEKMIHPMVKEQFLGLLKKNLEKLT